MARAQEHNKPLIAVRLERGYEPQSHSWLAAVCRRCQVYDLSDAQNLEHEWNKLDHRLTELNVPCINRATGARSLLHVDRLAVVINSAYRIEVTVVEVHSVDKNWNIYHVSCTQKYTKEEKETKTSYKMSHTLYSTDHITKQ